MGNQTVLPSTCQPGSKKEAQLSKDDKKDAWDELYEKFSSQNVHGEERSMDEMKKKWDNLTMTAKRDYSTWKREVKKTGKFV